MHPHGGVSYVWWTKQNQGKYPPENHYHSITTPLPLHYHSITTLFRAHVQAGRAKMAPMTEAMTLAQNVQRYEPRAVQFHPHGVNPISSGSPHVRPMWTLSTCGA